MDNDREVFNSNLMSAAAAMGLRLDHSHLDRMWTHFVFMVEANRQFNLTRITSPADAAIRHYADSLSLLAAPWAYRDRPLSVLDVGTGAGFPAVPLAIVCDRWQLTAIDGTGKKVRFVADTARALGLTNLEALHARAADLVRQGGEKFDLVLFRAVTQIAPGLDEAYSLVNASGAAVFYKTAAITQAELDAGTRVARRRGLPVMDTWDVQLPAPEGPLNHRLIRYARK